MVQEALHVVVVRVATHGSKFQDVRPRTVSTVTKSLMRIAGRDKLLMAVPKFLSGTRDGRCVHDLRELHSPRIRVESEGVGIALKLAISQAATGRPLRSPWSTCCLSLPCDAEWIIP